MARHSVVIVDDDAWKREGMVTQLGSGTEVAVVGSLDQETAEAQPPGWWKDIDAVIVDVFDDRAVGEVGTDLYGGLRVVEAVRDLPVRCIAVMPASAHPLVQLRLSQANPDYCYQRFEIRDVGALTDAIRNPLRDHRPTPPISSDLLPMGASRLLANSVVRTYRQSALNGLLRADTGLKELKASGVTRRDVDRFRLQVMSHGFTAPPRALSNRGWRSTDPRWPEVRDLVLKLLGRRDAPWSEHDRPWWASR